ncbi:MAG TPA: GAF domain-containing sensor histidine kinase [Polyangiaceae bacterium]|nr:GAF domain-containing sensor histidine kinase [Polyangiaceae bacterium]
MSLTEALAPSASLVAEWLGCDKVDAFFMDESRTALVALGTSDTPLGKLQKKLGLDVLPLANGGRAVDTYRTGESYMTGRADLDDQELVGIVRELGARSEINVALELVGDRRGVLAVVSQQPDRFSREDVQVLETIGRWISALAHRAELVEKLRDEERARARTTAAEQIMTVLSHDIRNHLGPLQGRLNLLDFKLRRGQSVEPDALLPALENVRRMARMTSTWLDVSRLNHGLFTLELAPLDLCALLREVAASLSTALNPVEVAAPSELMLLGDAERLRQTFENVLANGVRHSPAERPLRVVIEPANQKRWVQITVSDEGPGIAPELLPHLFERFVSSQPSRGIGLGLYLAERVIAAHGGTLRVSSKLGAGAHFCFELPCDGPAR